MKEIFWIYFVELFFVFGDIFKVEIFNTEIQVTQVLKFGLRVFNEFLVNMVLDVIAELMRDH